MMLDDQGVTDEWIVRVQGTGIRPGEHRDSPRVESGGAIAAGQ